MRVLACILAILFPLSGAAVTVQPRQHPYPQHWKQSTYGKKPVVGVAARAGVRQMTHHPKNWRGASGFGKQLGTGFATHAVKTTVEHAVAAPLHEDLHYHRSTKRGFTPRLRHALVSTVVTRNTKNGKRRPAAGRISGH